MNAPLYFIMDVERSLACLVKRHASGLSTSIIVLAVSLANVLQICYHNFSKLKLLFSEEINMEEPIQDLTPRIADCLKVIYDMQEHGQKVSTSAVSERLGVSDATVTMLFKDFAAAGLVEHLPEHSLGVTAPGRGQGTEANCTPSRGVNV